MAQGKLKAKVQKPGKGKQKSLRPTKHHVLRKGHLTIKPKKGKELETFKLRKNLERAINTNIEHDVSMKASSIQPQSFKLIKKDLTMPSRKSQPKISCLYGPTNTYMISTPVGELQLVSCPKGLHSLGQHSDLNDENFRPDYSVPVEILSQLYQDNGYVYKPAMQCVDWLKDYFNKSSEPGTVPLPPACLSISKKGSFTSKVWQTLPKLVPFGQSISYGRLAELCDNPKACRAVGHAMSENPLMLIMPCHRVIQTGGNLGNYHKGTRNSIKVWLLKHEGNIH
ncbi:hypothetical protein SNE40_006747 [Patella caerulea]|uniref:Methylated-DNA--protein-cysteine methyltransferase n=2 Tax=Patella caerulea TaxID=87958 RepID=A0AAN8JX47_PATCE